MIFFNSTPIIIISALITTFVSALMMSIRLTPLVNQLYGDIQHLLPASLLIFFNKKNIIQHFIMVMMLVLILIEIMIFPVRLISVYLLPVASNYLWLLHYFAMCLMNIYIATGYQDTIILKSFKIKIDYMIDRKKIKYDADLHKYVQIDVLKLDSDIVNQS